MQPKKFISKVIDATFCVATSHQLVVVHPLVRSAPTIGEPYNGINALEAHI